MKKVVALFFWCGLIFWIFHRSQLADEKRTSVSQPNRADVLEPNKVVNTESSSTTTPEARQEILTTSDRIEKVQRLEKVVAPPASPAGRFREDVFPALDSVSWYYGKYKPSDVDEFEEDVIAKSTFGKRLIYLIELKQKDLLNLSLDAEFDALLETYSTSTRESVAFSGAKEIDGDDLSALSEDAPTCVLRFERDKSIRFISKQAVFPVEGTELITPMKHVKGVRIIFRVDPKKNVATFIKSIDCLLKLKSESDERYLKLRMIHLTSTIGIRGTVSTPHRN